MSSSIDTGYFEVKYEAGHSYEEKWAKTEYFCPACGKQEVWHETSGGGYYVGETHLCLGCEAHFYLPNDPTPSPNDWQDKQRLEAIRSVIDSAATSSSQEPGK